jgi:hypothetical protein
MFNLSKKMKKKAEFSPADFNQSTAPRGDEELERIAESKIPAAIDELIGLIEASGARDMTLQDAFSCIRKLKKIFPIKAEENPYI